MVGGDKFGQFVADACRGAGDECKFFHERTELRKP
jgi:hypothetical protein